MVIFMVLLKINADRLPPVFQDFMVKYLGNVPSSANISTTGRLRKLFANEFSSDETTKQLQMIIDKLLQNIH